MSKPPQTRTCVGCFGKAQQKSLFKFGTGRHGYLHFDDKCWEVAIKKNALNRALRRKVTEIEKNDIEKAFREKLTAI
ncbi:MAG: YlxR family protein [candidate division WWE3 bacterium]|nr:YlxR family protein [candidate division WWE3 bacterium]